MSIKLTLLLLQNQLHFFVLEEIFNYASNLKNDYKNIYSKKIIN